MASWRPPESSWAPGGSHWAAKAARKRNLGGSWVRLGRSWWLLGRSGGLPGRSWGFLGRSWSLLGRSVHFGFPGVTFWSLLDFFLVSPCEIAKTSKFIDSMALLRLFQVPRAPKSFENQLREPLGLWAAQLGNMRLKWRYMRPKLGYIGPK